jgi:hypothetical protein
MRRWPHRGFNLPRWAGVIVHTGQSANDALKWLDTYFNRAI